MKDLIIDFLNTEWYLTHKLNRELLKDKTFLRQFLDSKGYYIKKLPDEDVIEELLNLRFFLSDVLKKYVKSKAISSKDIDKINLYLQKTLYHKTVTKFEGGYNLVAVPENYNWSWFIAEIIASFIELMNGENKDRLKRCENPECGFFFYDETKNRTKRWCDNRCASLMKVRRFRAKSHS